MGEESSSPLRNDATPWNLHDFLEEAVWDSTDLFPELHVQEELVEEVMEELYKEMTCSPAPTTQTCNLNIPSPQSLLPARLVFVDDGQSESCGASVSDSSSTVMAGVEYVAAGVGEMTEKNNIAGLSVEREVEGCGGVEFDEEWLERVMTWIPLELEGWT